jgi:hypothetical protein
MSDLSTKTRWWGGPTYRYGMLVVIAALILTAIWSTVQSPDPDRRDFGVNLVVGGVLLLNHLVAHFLPAARQRIVQIPVAIFVILACLYVFGRLAGWLPT